ncbi:GDP-mannose 4,6-dehydratase [Verrucomicrobia bacterium]|nr:GDP-mannose 4,6-dehydratase [Verrucomicrobiota bacterium]
MPTALISGITGQDGSYLTELLLEKGYTIHGIVRRTSSLERSRLRHLFDDSSIYGKRLYLHYADLDDATALRRLIVKVAPDEFYHLAGQSHVGLSFDIPESTCRLTAMATLGILEIIRDLDNPPRFYHASSAEVFGSPDSLPQNETTPFRPVTPYGCAKAFATSMVTVYRNSFALHAVNGIAFNHESTRRGENFVTRKICHAAAAIKAGKLDKLHLGDTTAKRDWGWAPDFVHGMWLALQHSPASEYVFATGVQHSVQDIVDIAFNTVGLNWQEHLERDERFIRPADPCLLVGDASKARNELGWKTTISFEDMIQLMTDKELTRLS